MNLRLCEFCETPFPPRNWKDRACQEPECQEMLRSSKLDQRRLGYVSKNPERPIVSNCQWADCPEVFSIPPRGVIPIWCPKHREENHLQQRRVDRDTQKICEWESCGGIFTISKLGTPPRYCGVHAKESKRLRRLANTVDIQCCYPNCPNKQHASGRGWCASHKHLYVRYKLTGEKWLSLFEQQKGCCPICRNRLFNGERIHVDHDHGCCFGHSVSCGNCVRGILHYACNTNIIGQIETAYESGHLFNALEYLFQVPAARIELALRPPRDQN